MVDTVKGVALGRTVQMQDSQKTVSTFVTKLYSMLEDPAATPIIEWTPQENSFIVHSPMEFQEAVLPKYFKHNNFSSFVRQLNLYGFHKIGEPQYWEFHHEHFIRGQKDLLCLIRRRAGANAEKLQTGTRASSMRAAAAAAAAASVHTRSMRDPVPSSSSSAAVTAAAAAAAAAAVAAATAAHPAAPHLLPPIRVPTSESEYRSTFQQMAERLRILAEDNVNMHKQLMATQAELADVSSKFKRVLQIFGSMVFNEDELQALHADKRRRPDVAPASGAAAVLSAAGPAASAPTGVPRAMESLSDLHRPSLPVFNLDFSRPSQLNVAQALGRLSDTNFNLRSLSSMRYIPADLVRSGLSMTQLPPLNEAPGDPDYEAFMKEVSDSGVETMRMHTMAAPALAAAVSASAAPVVLDSASAPAAAGAAAAAPPTVPGGPGSAAAGSAAVGAGAAAPPAAPTSSPALPVPVAAPLPASPAQAAPLSMGQQQLQDILRTKRAREEEAAGVMLAMRRSSTGPGTPGRPERMTALAQQFVAPQQREQLKQLLMEMRSGEETATGSSDMSE